MNASTLNRLLQQNVLDIRFARRRPRAGVPPTRRMLCTLNENILNSVNGRTVLNYFPPANTVPYELSGKNLSMTWDIMMQDFRMVSAESTTVVNTYKPDDTFWQYFNENILPMDVAAKSGFMNS